MNYHSRIKARRFGSLLILSALVALLCAAGVQHLPNFGQALSFAQGFHPADGIATLGFIVPICGGGWRRISAPFEQAPAEGSGGTAPATAPDFTKMSEADFRKTLGDGIQLIDTRTKATEGMTTELKTKLDEALNDAKTRNASVDEISKKLLDIQTKLLALQLGGGSNDGRSHAERVAAHTDACKRIATAAKAGASFTIRALGEDSGTGANIVNPTLASDIYSAILDYGDWRMLGVRPMSTKTEKLIIKTQRATAVWVPENGVIPESGSNYNLDSITAKKVACLLGVSNELEEDAVFNIGEEIGQDFAQAVAERLDHSFFAGDGTSDVGGLNGGFTGLFFAGTQVAAGAGHTTVEDLAFDEILGLLTAVNPVTLKRNPVWMMAPTMLPRLLSIKDADGHPIFLPSTSVPTLGALGSILGFPVRLISAAPNTNAADKRVMAFGDPKAYAVGLRKDFQFDRSTDARFDADQTVYRGKARAAGKIRDASAIAVLKTAAA